MLFSALILNLPGKHHVHSTTACTKYTRIFRDDVPVINAMLNPNNIVGDTLTVIEHKYSTFILSNI